MGVSFSVGIFALWGKMDVFESRIQECGSIRRLPQTNIYLHLNFCYALFFSLTKHTEFYELLLFNFTTFLKTLGFNEFRGKSVYLFVFSPEAVNSALLHTSFHPILSGICTNFF